MQVRANFQEIGGRFDPDEIVYLPGRGELRLRAAIREVMDRRRPRQAVTLYRDEGKTPSFLDGPYIEGLAKLPSFR
jgi:hypothetical protein